MIKKSKSLRIKINQSNYIFLVFLFYLLAYSPLNFAWNLYDTFNKEPPTEASKKEKLKWFSSKLSHEYDSASRERGTMRIYDNGIDTLRIWARPGTIEDSEWAMRCLLHSIATKVDLMAKERGWDWLYIQYNIDGKYVYQLNTWHTDGICPEITYPIIRMP
ncbi:MAG: hypothetical protein ABTQ93_08905 [Candidatus Competibacter denitrificans]